MAIYIIIRVYEVPAETKQQATERMLQIIVKLVWRLPSFSKAYLGSGGFGRDSLPFRSFFKENRFDS